MITIKKIVSKYSDVLPYLFFGVCTTLVNIIVYWLFARVLSFSTMISTVVAWVMAVLFAYITNRKWVFKSTSFSYSAVIREVISFLGCRLLTGVLDWASMYVLIDILQLDDLLIKALSNVIVIILNYIASKLIIFKRSSISNEE